MNVSLSISLFVPFVPFCGLSGSWFIGFGDANPVIGKGGVHAGEFDFRHVTARAVLCAHRTGRGAATLSLRFLRGRQMTRETLAIVIRRVLLQLLVRVVTRKARDARIVRVVTAAIEHSIR